MRVGLVAVAVAASGCLYVGEVNTAPKAALTIESMTTTLHKGAQLTVIATLSDAEDDRQTLKPLWEVSRADGSAVDPACDFALTPYGFDSPGRPRAYVQFFRTGMWTIQVSTVDRYKAESNSSTVMVEVVDAPPEFTQAIDQLRPTVAKQPACNTYVAGQPLPLVLDGKVEDPDAKPPVPLVCNARESYFETLRYRWKIVGLPADSHAVLAGKSGDAPCPAAPPANATEEWIAGVDENGTAVCFWPDVGGSTLPKMYQVVVYVSDGHTEIASTPFTAPVRDDLPPCVTGAAPAPSRYVVDRAEPQYLQVTGVADELDAFGTPKLSYVWSLWRENDPVWRTIPSWSLSSYTLDASDFGVGEQVRVRVEAVDRTTRRAACDPDDGVCTVETCLLASQTCNRWVTWDLELR